jgi:hypothetical protein
MSFPTDTDLRERPGTAERLGRANIIPVIQVPYFDDIGVNDVDAVLEELIGKIETRPQATPISYQDLKPSELTRVREGESSHGFARL